MWRKERLDQLAAQLHAAEAELGTRDLASLSTGRLLSLVESLHSRIRREAGPVQFVTSVDTIPENEYADRIHVWQP